MRTKENLLSFCRMQPILCKDSANENKRELVLILLSAAYLMQKYDKKLRKRVNSILLNVSPAVQP